MAAEIVAGMSGGVEAYAKKPEGIGKSLDSILWSIIAPISRSSLRDVESESSTGL